MDISRIEHTNKFNVSIESLKEHAEIITATHQAGLRRRWLRHMLEAKLTDKDHYPVSIELSEGRARFLAECAGLASQAER